MSTNKFSDLSEIDLIKLYRRTNSQRKRSMIFNVILFEKTCGNKTWDENIKNYVYNSRGRLSYHDSYHDVEDLYQEVLQSLHVTLEKYFNVNSQYGFATYAWQVIRTAVDRVFQTSRTKKRKIKIHQSIEINNLYDENKKFVDVISNANMGIYRTVQKEISIDELFFQKDLLDYLKRTLQPEPIDGNEFLIKELKKLVTNKCTNVRILKNLAIKYDVSLEKIQEMKEQLKENIEKQMFLDILRFIEHEVRDDGVLAKRYKCSRSQITKNKQKLAGVLKREVNKVGLGLADFL